MEITINKNGKMQGTIGWLATGIENGDISFEEGNLKSNGNHGLWLKGPAGLSQFLGAFNRFGLEGHDLCDIDYDIADDHQDRDQIWTDAAWKILMDISQKWCDEMNEIIEDEKEIEVVVLRATT